MQSPACDEATRQLSDREQEVFDLCMQGLSNKEIGEKLFVATRTIQFHMNNILRKREAKNRIELILKEAKARGK